MLHHDSPFKIKTTLKGGFGMDTILHEHLNRRKSALIGGTALIIMALAAFFSYGLVYENLVLQGDANATFNSLKSSNTLFTAGVFGWFIILITDIVVTWAFYTFLEPINRSLALLAAWLRLTYTTILGVAILNLVFVLLLTNGTDNLSFNIDQLQAHIMLFLEAFETTWAIDLIIFGGHLLVIGFIAFKSSEIPKVISILLLLAAIGYIIINVFISFFSQYNEVISILKFIFNVPMIVGELGFGIWLLIRGGKVSKAG